MSTSSFDYCVLGAGLAGLSISKYLLAESVDVCLIDVADVASGASGTPLGLVNPATGRWGTKVWEAENCYPAIAADLDEIQQRSSDQIFKKTGILRPAQKEKMARRMHENVIDNDWPEGWCQWLDKKEVHEINSKLHCINGGMWLPLGLTVKVDSYLKAKAKYLQEKGLAIKTNTEYSLSARGDHYEIILEDGEIIKAKNLINTAGNQSHTLPNWDILPIHEIKGQVALFESPEAGTFDYSISALGYIASVSKTTFVAGSTYEHHFDNLGPDEEGLQYLINRLSGVYPALFKEAKLVGQWAGVRASTPNHKPILGPHPDIKNQYLFSGLGSKGLIYSDYLASVLIGHIFREEPIPGPVSIHRI